VYNCDDQPQTHNWDCWYFLVKVIFVKDVSFSFCSSPLTATPVEEVPAIQIAERFVSGVSFNKAICSDKRLMRYLNSEQCSHCPHLLKQGLQGLNMLHFMILQEDGTPPLLPEGINNLV